jgi:hypothetical protein
MEICHRDFMSNPKTYDYEYPKYGNPIPTKIMNTPTDHCEKDSQDALIQILVSRLESLVDEKKVVTTG